MLQTNNGQAPPLPVSPAAQSPDQPLIVVSFRFFTSVKKIE
ncbi:hypothetical protein Q0M94_26665 (plasmid) [Deinococcus radiomollis]